MKKFLATILIFTAFCATAKNRIGENIDMTHYEIHLNNIDFTNHTLEAYTIVTLTAKETINSFDLELKSLVVSDVMSNDGNVSGFVQNGDVLTINLATALAANTNASFTITYGGNTFNEQWGGIMWSGNYVCNMGVGFESIPHNLGKCWFPCVDNFTDKATYDVYVTVPTETTAVCGGNLISDTDNGDGTHSVHYVVNQEIATYHISFAAGDYVEWTDTYNGIERDIPITVYVKPSQINNVPGTFVHVKDIAEYFENAYGPYPFNRIGYSITSVGCMEHVDNIGITSGILTGNTDQESYIAHEMSHMWFGNKVTCARAEEMWLNEGFAQFCGTSYQEAIYDEATYLNEMRSVMAAVITGYDPGEGWLALNNVPQDLTYGNTVYKKGATVVHTLRNYLGKELFNETMRHYLNKFAYQSVTSEDLRDAITEYTGIDMTDFFDTYVFTCGEPHYVIDNVNITPNGNNFNVEVFTSQTHRHSDHIGNSVILELDFMDQNWNIVTDTIHWDGRTGHTVKTLDFEPVAVFCNYNKTSLDARVDRNFVINTTGKVTATYLDINTSEITDSTFLHIENHWVGPDHSLNPHPWEMTFSTQRYYTVFRDDKGQANINGVFRYAKSYDNDIIQSANDSTVLLYRENAITPWHSIPYSFEGNWKIGEMTVDELLSGDYTFAVIDKTTFGLGEIPTGTKRLIVMPNPADDFIKISTSDNNTEVCILNSLGQIANIFSVKEKEITIPITDYKSGVYYINLLDENKNIISTEKLVKR
jgi:aminopeptidase N